jgi:hypothetical protein
MPEIAPTTGIGLGRHRRLAFPDFFVVGHPKCGTTALHWMLSSHPEVFMPMKEPRFFAPELRSRWHRLGPNRVPETLGDYLALFAGAKPGQRIGEATPAYLRSQGAAEQIHAVAPDAKIIAVFREPLSFLRSLHLQMVHNYVETETDFRRAIELEPVRRAGKRIPRFSQVPSAVLYSDYLHYTEQLSRFHEFFRREQVLVLIYEDFRSDNAATVKRVLEFIGVDSAKHFDIVETTPLQNIRSLPLYQLQRAVAISRKNAVVGSSVMRLIDRVVPSRWPSEALHSLWRKAVFAPAQPHDKRFDNELRRRSIPEVEAFGDYIERDLLELWGYS